MKKKVLVADDDPAIVESVCMMLEEYGYQTLSTEDGKTIYELGDDLPDVLLLDIWMSGEDGRRIASHLKKQDKTKNIPIIMISASRDIAKSAKDSGADDFLAKPFDMNELIGKIEAHIQGRKHEQATS